jgi:flagellar basal body-associated protein FliL
MSEKRKGITVMMLGFIIGIILLAVVVIFVFYFYGGDLFGGILKGFRNAVEGFMGGSPGGGGASGEW